MPWQAKRIPADLKSVYSNAVTRQQQQDMQVWLKRKGFTHKEDKSTVSLHIIHQATASNYAVSYTNSNGRGAPWLVLKTALDCA